MNPRAVPVLEADILRWKGLTWRQLTAELNARYKTNWQPESVAGAVYRWRAERRRKIGVLKT